MGWFFINGGTRADLVRTLVKTEESENTRRETLAYTVIHEKGYDVLWSVVQITAKPGSQHPKLAPGQSRRYIGCDLMQCYRDDWGNKPLGEADAPYYYSCPLSYLDMAPEANAAWRADVRAWHASQQQAA